jgi:hypothetical protein
MDPLQERRTPAAPGVEAKEAWLVPFGTPASQRTLRSRVRLEGERLTIRWVLQGELGDLRLPSPGGNPRRLDELWRATCFEAFISCAQVPGYLELNLSPAGHWAAYRFDAPRQGMRHEPGLTGLDWGTHRVPGRMAIRLSFEWRSAGLEPGGPGGPGGPGTSRDFSPAGDPAPPPPQPAASHLLRLGLSAILLRTDGQREFWALQHPGDAPDFHHPGGHVLELPTST